MMNCEEREKSVFEVFGRVFFRFFGFFFLLANWEKFGGKRLVWMVLSYSGFFN